MANAYNWMSAADKVVLDSHTAVALDKSAAEARKAFVGSPYRHGDPKNGLVWAARPEYHAQLAAESFRDPATQNPNVHQARVDIADKIRATVKKLDKNATDEDINDSIGRHAFRAQRVWDEEHTPGPHDTSRDLIHPTQHPGWNPNTESNRNELKTRYRRRYSADEIKALEAKLREGTAPTPAATSSTPSVAPARRRWWP